MNNQNKILTDNLFKIGLIIKGADGILKIVGGILLFFIKESSINNFITLIFQHELLQDPGDFVGNFLINISSNLSLEIQHFLAIYFLINGIVKISLIIGLWKNKLKAYIIAEIVFVILIIYEVYKLFLNPSVYLSLLITIDVIVVVLIWLKYLELKTKNQQNENR